MSKVIDERVVSMQFDNKRFEQNVAETMSTLDKLKQRLQMHGATKGLEDVNTAANKVNLSGLSSAVETVGLKFNSMYTIADQALRNITSRVQFTAERMISALTIDPIKTGLSEYETKIGSIQTIMSNTSSKGTTMEDVTRVIGELNTYADKTIYNFAEMTRNIGTFTAAGVGLEESATAIQGIANLAAMSGSNSQQASTAMYQLSQAMASGTVKLMDWNSVVNAGMGGELFQNALKETAKTHGVAVDNIIKKHGSFRDSLTEGWITTDILTETLAKMTKSGAAEYLSNLTGIEQKQIEAAQKLVGENKDGKASYEELAKQLAATGKVTKEQAIDILKMADNAEDAATKVKTFTQLWDTLKESAQSGWSQTWEILIGDFEEAKETLTEISNVIGDVINASAESRNELLKGWKDAGGRTDLVDSLFNIFKAIGSIAKPIKEAFSEIFPPLTVQQLVDFTKGLKSFTERLTLSKTASENLKRTFKGLFAVLDIGKQFITAVFTAIKPLFGSIDDLGGGILGTTASLGDWLVKLSETIKTTNVFGKAAEKIGNAFMKIGGFLKSVIEGIKDFGNVVSEVFSGISKNAEERLGILTIMGNAIKSLFSGLGNIFKTVAPFFYAVARGIGNVFSDLMDRITSSVANTDYNGLFDALNGGIISAIGIFIAKFIKSGGDLLDNAGGFVEGLNDILGGVSDTLNAFQGSLQADTLKKIATAIAILAASLLVLSLIDSDKLTLSLVAISALFGELMTSMSIFTKIIGKNGTKGLGKMAAALIGISAALLVLSFALKIVSSMSWEEMFIGLTGATAGLAAMVAAVNLLPENNVKKAAKAIKTMSTALLILSIALKIMGSMSWTEMGIGLITMVVGLAALVGAVNLLPKDTAVRAAGMVGLATAVVILAGALKIMGSMSWEEIARGLVALVGAMAAVVVVMQLMKSAIPGALAMLVVAPALVMLAGALKIMSTMSWEEIARGLVALAGSLTIIAVAMLFMKTAILGASALLVISAALAILAPVLKILGSMSWGEIARGLVAIAGAFAIMGVAALVLGPLVPTILGLSGALALLGIGCAAIGVGVVAVAAGLTAIAGSGAAIATALVMIVSSVIGLIPYLLEQIGLGIIKLCETLAGGSKAICEAVTVIVLAIVDALVAAVPPLVEGLFVLIDEILKTLVAHTPSIVASLFDFIIAILDGIAAKLPDLIQSAINVLMAFFTGVVEALKGIDTNTLLQGLVGIGILSAIMMALSAVAALVPGALLGVLGMGVVITELALVLAAIGALAQIPGLDWLIGEGGQLLQSIGVAIGQFFGGIAGGFMTGVSSQFPQIANDLSAFMTNLQPFIEGAKQVDSSMMEGVKSLAEVILILTAANILEGLTSWITGGSSLEKFGSQLPTLGSSLRAFASSLGKFDEGTVSTVTCAANAIKALAEAASVLPNEGGWAAKIFGENSIATFSSYLPDLAASLNAFATNLGPFDETTVTTVGCAANAIKVLAEAASALPNEGGWAAKIFGDNSLSAFSDQLANLGTNLSSFATNLGTFGEEKVATINSAVKAIKAFASLADSNLKGAKKNIDGFGDKLGSFGSNLKTFCDNLPESSSINAAVKNVNKIIDMIKNMSSANSDAVSGFANAMKDLGNSGVDSFVNAFTSSSAKANVSNAGKELIHKVIEGAESNKSALKKAASAIVAVSADSIRDKYESFYNAGSYLVDGFSAGISENDYKAEAKAAAMAKAAAEAAKKALDINSPSKVFKKIGSSVPEGFVMGIEMLGGLIRNSSIGMANEALTTVKTSIARLSDIVSDDIDTQPTIRPVLDLSDVRAGAGELGSLFGGRRGVGVVANVGAISSMMNQNHQNGGNDDVVSAINKLRADISKSSGDTYTFGDMTYDDGSNIANALSEVARAAKIERRR